MTRNAHSRREFLAATAAVGAACIWPRQSSWAVAAKKTFTILHTNDLHSNLIGLGPATEYSPFSLNDDNTRGGFARIAALLLQRKKARGIQGPVLILDDGDFSMGTAFGAITRETGCELQLLFAMGCDATTLGNHEFDFGPDGLAESIRSAAKAGRCPPILASNTDFTSKDERLTGLQKLGKEGVIRSHLVIERGGLKFGLFGLLGKEAAMYTLDKGQIVFTDPVEKAREMVKLLREKEKVDLVICLSHAGVVKRNGRFTDGEDNEIAQAVPGIDIVIGGHSHTELAQPIMINGRTPVVQTGKYGENLGEMVLSRSGDQVTVESYQLHPIDDSIEGDKAIEAEVKKLKDTVTELVFRKRGYHVDQALAVAPSDLPNTFTDLAAGTPLANLVTDAIRQATGADVAFTGNGALRAGLTRGIQTVYDIFAMSPLGTGVNDNLPGGSLVTGYLTANEMKGLLEHFLIDDPVHPGEFFPRTSGLRFRYDPSRREYDRVTAIELGDLNRGYHPIDTSEKNENLYSLSCNLYIGLIIVSLPKLTQGKVVLTPKNKTGKPLETTADALAGHRAATPDLLHPRTHVDPSSAAVKENSKEEIKEWQAIMDHLQALPKKPGEKLPTIPLDDRAKEVRAISKTDGRPETIRCETRHRRNRTPIFRW
jgi:5'-nucleotidase